MSNGYFLADTNSLVFAYRSGGPELLDEYRRIAASQQREFIITKIVESEIEKGPLGKELLQYFADRNIAVLPTPDTEQRIRDGSLPRKSAGDYSMLEVAARESKAGRATRIWADDVIFDSTQIMSRHPDAHRTMTSELLDEAYDQKFIDANDYQRFRAGYQAQGAFIDSARLNSFRHDIPTPDAHSSSLSMRGVKLGLAAEAAVTAYEWNETRQRAQVFANTLQNESAARDAYVRQGAQTGGALVGTAVGGGAAVAVGAGTGGTAVLVTGSAYLFATAAEHGMELWQKQQVYNIHSEGVDWKFNGKQWIREDLRADLVDDGQDVTRRQDFAAPPDKARELSAAASAKAVEQALGAVPEPRNPFVLPANDSDAHSLRTRDWNYQPDTGQWLREVVTDLDHREMPGKFKTIEADDARAAQLSAQAQRIIDDNLRAGPAEIAAQYQMGHKALGYAQTPAGAMPDAIGPALDPDLLQASDKKHYRRDAQGEWMHDGQAATPTRALELELTRDRLLPALEAHRQQLARMPDWQPPTPEEQDRAALREAYLNRGINREAIPENFEASYLAIQRTRADTGVSAANTSLVLGEDANGQFTPDSPIHHVRFAEDGTLRIAATTTREDIAQALADVRAHGRSEDTPQQAAPERVIAQATPEERDAREQAQCEANRQGLSQDSVLQVVAAPSPSMGSGKRDAESREEEMPRDRSHEQRADNGPASPDATPPTPPRPPRSADPRDPDHPGHGLYKQIETGVAKLDASIGRTFDATSERLAMSTFHDARAAGMTSVHHVVLNNTGARQPDGSQIQANTLLIAIQGEDPHDPAAKRSVTDVKQAVGQSLEHSLQKVVTLEQQQAQTQPPNPTQDDPTQRDPGPKGPRL